MASLPLLVFPQPEKADIDRGNNFPPRQLHKPTITQQGMRLGPKLDSLQRAFEARRVEVQHTTTGIDPEQVLVIETIGSVDGFAKAVARVEGLEWLGEYELEEIAPDDDFYFADQSDKPLNGRLYLLMSNQQALNQMLSLWDRYKKDPDIEWGYGLTRFRDVFQLLHDIRRWGIKERLEETGALDAWREDIDHFPDRPVKLEIELWFRGDEARRNAAERTIVELVTKLGGHVLSRCVLQSIAYHGILIELPAGEIRRIVNHEAIDLIKCDSIMFFRPVGQMATGKDDVEGEAEESIEDIERPLPSGEPIVAVLDGMPLENHRLLVGRLLIDDPDEFTADCATIHRVHGTSMCSLVTHGDLSDGNQSQVRPVYVRPIMKPIAWHRTPWPEEMPRDMLAIDLIHRAVHRIFEGDGNEPAVAPSVRIINLSIGDKSRPFFQLMSSLARLLDWLSNKYNVLFVVSAGNQTHNLDLDVSESEFRKLNGAEREALAIKKLYEDARNRRMFSPAESINAITVGAVHHDSSRPSSFGRLLELYTEQLPSPISSFGGGYRRSVKPDLTFPGGRVLYDYSPTGTTIVCRPRLAAPGNCSATVGDAGDVRKVCFSTGTSNSAALISHHLGHCYESLVELLESQAETVDNRECISPLLKAMIVHGCSWSSNGDRLRDILATEADGRSIRHWISQWLGYGVPDTWRVRECTNQRATVFGFGELTDGKAHVFELPLPPSLGSRTDWRRLTVTLAWLSPIFSTTQKYRAAKMWFDIQNSTRLTPNRVNGERHEVQRGTVQHEVFDGDKAEIISDGDTVSIKVNCRADAGKLTTPVRYGLAVSLEVAEGVAIPIYEEVRTRIRPEIEIRERNLLDG